MTTTLTNGDANRLTDREQEILKNAWNCFKAPPEVDYGRLAEACGMSNVGSASNAWAKIKKKLFSDLPADTPAAKMPRTANKRKATAKKVMDDGDEANPATLEMPTKKRRASPKKKATVVKSQERVPKEEDEDDDDELAGPGTADDGNEVTKSEDDEV